MKCKRNTIPSIWTNEIKAESNNIVLGVFSEKGGSCKSTVSYQLLNVLAKSGLKVKGIDTDPQGTLYNQWTRLGRGYELFQKMKYFDHSNAFEVVQHDINLDLLKVLEISNRDGYDVIVIDTPSHLSDNHSRLFSQCDLAIFTFNDTDDDIATSDRVKMFVESAKRQYGNVAQSYSLLTEQPNTPADRERELQEDWKRKGYETTHPLLDARIINRQIYRDVKRAGLAVGDISGKYGTLANNEQIAYIIEIFDRTFQLDQDEALAS